MFVNGNDAASVYSGKNGKCIDTIPKGNPYRANGVSAAPETKASQNGGGRERTRLDRTMGATKYAFAQTPTGDRAPSTGDIIRALSRREREMMKQITDQISTVVRARWH